MKKATIILFLLLSLSIFAQKPEINSEVSHQIESLKEKNIQTFYIVEKNCAGCYLGTPKIYILWKEKGGSFFKKIDKINSQKVRISEDIFKNYKTEIGTIAKEEVKSYQTGKNSFIDVDHSTFSKYYFILNGEIIVKEIDDFNLTTEEKKPNINFDYNNSLTLVKLDKKLDEIIRKNP